MYKKYIKWVTNSWTNLRILIFFYSHPPAHCLKMFLSFQFMDIIKCMLDNTCLREYPQVS